MDEYEPLYEGLGYNRSVIEKYLDQMKKYIDTPRFNSGNMRKKRSAENAIRDHHEWSEINSDKINILEEPTQLEPTIFHENNEFSYRGLSTRIEREVTSGLEYGDVTHCWTLAKSKIGKLCRKSNVFFTHERPTKTYQKMTTVIF